MWIYYNAHPQGKRVGDCVKRAITVAAEMDYKEVARELNRYKKITGAAAFNSDYNPHKYVENVLHGIKLSFPAVRGEKRMNGERFCREYSKGRYILCMAGHWSCCVDGVIYDTWDCSEKCVYTAYEILSNNNNKPQLKDAKFASCITTRRIKSKPGILEVKEYDRHGEHQTFKMPISEALAYVDKKKKANYSHIDLDAIGG